MPRLRSLRPDILCICNFGRDQANSIKQANDFGLKKAARIVVPVLLHNQRLAGGADAFEGVVGASNYYWRLEETVPSAKAFNDAFRAAYADAIPTDYGAYGYTAVRSLLMAVKAAGDTDTDQGRHGAGRPDLRRREGAGALPRLRPPGDPVRARHGIEARSPRCRARRTCSASWRSRRAPRPRCAPATNSATVPDRTPTSRIRP